MIMGVFVILLVSVVPSVIAYLIARRFIGTTEEPQPPTTRRPRA